MTDDTDDLKWPRELWAAERDEFDPTGFYVLSEHATIARFEGDHERDREFHRYIDGDILESTERYYKARLETLSALHQQALDAARQEGRRQGLKEAAKWVKAGPDLPDRSHLRQSDFNKLSEEILALIDKPADPVAEAARVLLNKWLDGEFEDGADAAADDAITDQWAHVDRTYPDASPIIEAWLRALAQKEGE